MRSTLIIGGAAIVAIIIGVLLFFYGDGHFSKGHPPETGMNSMAAVAVPFTELARGAHSDVSTRTNYLITSASELEKLWKMISASGKMPAVDFTKNSVAAVFAGREPTTSYAVAVSKVEDTDVRTVTVTLTEPDDSCTPKASTSSPYEIISLPKTSLAFTHEDRTTVFLCTDN